ncbi:unnamed protein product [Phytophthora fragariaefolia]|uniref:Unnamed protein product n=1 Tax=Phytophthora fragariaefolia TaxID=1490495 RepID=A0A9W6YFU1_9STRA|nr:unnamed protein product [Phytophthora fragariaefolia]
MSASNGKAERFHRTVMDSARAMLWASALPKRFWGDAVHYASYIRNYLPTRANADHASPIEALTGKVPDVSHILRFGAKCTNHIAHATKKSAKKRAEKGVIIGIDPQQKAYHVSIPRTKRIISTTHVQNIDRLDPRAVGRCMDAVTTDNIEPETTQTSSAASKSGDDDQRSDDEEDLQQGSPAELHNLNSRAIKHIFGLNRGARALPQDDFQLPQSFLDEFVTPSTLLLTIGLEGGTAFTILLNTTNINTPATVAEAIKSPHWHKWTRAMQEELKAIAGNATWEIVETPRDGNLISAKWVFKIKFDSRGELERFKARLVASTKTALWHAIIRQGDVPNAYLRADLERPIYMRAPIGLSVPKGKCLRLQKSLYGLKQSGKLWSDTMHKFLLEIGFARSKLDPCLYFRRSDDKLTVLGLYGDDIVVVSQRESDSDWVMQKLADQFEIKDMGPAKKCLGINIDQTETGICLHQTANIDSLLMKLGMENCRPVTTPMESTRGLHSEDAEPFLDTDTMRETIGSLLWLGTCTRPDITLAVNYLARFVSAPTTTQWTGVKRVLRYLRGSRDWKFGFARPQAPRTQVNVAIFSETDWAGDKDAKSTSGGLLTMDNMLISWYTVQDCLWVKQLINELGLHNKDDAVILHIDNQSAIKNMENDVTTARMKHINIKFHFIRDAIRKEGIQIRYCPTTEMKADILTKPLGGILHSRNVAIPKLITPDTEQHQNA